MAGNDLALPRHSRESLRIVTAADEMLRADPARPIYTDTLCAALAVSPSKMFNAFRAAYHVRPHQFLKRRRLSMVRRALAHSFVSPGRFAAAYRDMFGDMPSQTLARGTG